MSKKTIIIIAAAVLSLCCIAFVAVLALGGLTAIMATQPAADTGNAFMTALKDGDYDKAYGMCTSDLQQELGSARNLRSMIESNDVQPIKWNFNSRNIQNDTAELSGDVTLSGNRNGTVELVLQKSGNDWKVAGFSIQES